MKRRNDIVSAAEIASWSWCPESWRLNTLGAEPSNQVELARGETYHQGQAAFEERSRSAISIGWCICVFAVLLGLAALVAFFLSGES